MVIKRERNAMALINIAWSNELNWDGSSINLEDQAFEPVRNPLKCTIHG